jgi:hypothetical protein
VLFFHNNSLKLFVKVGKAREDELYAKAGYEVLSNFDKRYTELKRYLKYLFCQPADDGAYFYALPIV